MEIRGLLCTGDLTKAIELIKKWEGFSSTVYICAAGYPTIGFGTRCSLDHSPVTAEQAENMLTDTVSKITKGIWKLLGSRRDLITDNELNAIVSLAYNIGYYNFKDSTLLKLLLAGKELQAAEEFLKWKFITVDGKKVISKGLLTRRRCERKLFLTP